MEFRINMSPEDAKFMTDYAAARGKNVGDVIRDAALARIEDELEHEAIERAIAEYKANPATYSHDEIGRMLGLK